MNQKTVLVTQKQIEYAHYLIKMISAKTVGNASVQKDIVILKNIVTTMSHAIGEMDSRLEIAYRQLDEKKTPA